MVYLIHFSKKYHHAQHYLGFTGNLEQRIEQHLNSQGAKLLIAVNEAGIKWKVVRLWPGGTRATERHLKQQKNGCKLCPICKKHYVYYSNHK